MANSPPKLAHTFSASAYTVLSDISRKHVPLEVARNHLGHTTLGMDDTEEGGGLFGVITAGGADFVPTCLLPFLLQTNARFTPNVVVSAHDPAG